MTSLSDKQFREVSDLTQRVEEMEASPQNRGIDPWLQAVLQSWKSTIEDISHRVQGLENVTPTTNQGNFFSTLTLGSNKVSQDRSGFNGGVADTVQDVSDRLHKLESIQASRGRDGLTGSVRFGGITFTGTRDVQDWLDEKLGISGDLVPPYGLFPDPLLILHWAWVILAPGETSTLRDMRDRDALSMSQDQLYAIQSFQHYVPLIFSGKKTSMMINTSGMSASRLGQITIFESWDGVSGQLGLKQQMAEAMNKVKDSLTDLIQETFNTTPEVRSFALGMLHTSISFVKGLSMYMSETHNNFKDVVGNTSSVWGLVTNVVEQLFKKDFGQVRAKTIGSIDARSQGLGYKIIWSSIHSVGVAQDLMSHGIKNAPAVSASYVRFVMMHSNMGKVTSLMEEIKLLKRKCEALETSVTEVKKLAEGARKVADQAMTKVGNSNKRLRHPEETKEN